MTITRSDIEGIIDFLAANPEGATDLEREALAAYQADPEAAIERALAQTAPAATVETFVMFSREQLRHAGARIAETARFRTLSGRMSGDPLKYTSVTRTGIGQHEIQCSGCGQGHRVGTFKFQSDATTAARTHANRCLA